MRKAILGLIVGILLTFAAQRVARYVRFQQHRGQNAFVRWAYMHVPSVMGYPGTVRMVDAISLTRGQSPAQRTRGEQVVKVRMIYEIDGSKVKVITTDYRLVGGKFVPPTGAELKGLDAAAVPIALPQLSE